ncbi:hypothetical protein HCN44_008800 [Aphidius gifuensis]|uniref:Uncharacterized protein n=1 Tax=Aphidius gifuensis TaxID=684658 RepID=A0A835CRR4_APHGI|nr:hypothetical protein HCN44_008800 [Aphidius gifuensis]
MANESISSSLSFSGGGMKYSAENIDHLYQQISANLNEIQKLSGSVDTNMKNIRQEMIVTAKLLDAIDKKNDKNLPEEININK